MKTSLFLSVFFLLTVGAVAQSRADKTVLSTIAASMKEQEQCWNRGDISCFMQHYWKSDSLRFMGKSGVTYGWQKTLDNYLASYPDRKAMGILHFTHISSEFIDKETVLVLGGWKLKREGGLEDLKGHYSLLWKNKNGRWVIVLDHSS